MQDIGHIGTVRPTQQKKLQNAVSYMSRKPDVNVRHLATKFKVPRSTLMDHSSK